MKNPIPADMEINIDREGLGDSQLYEVKLIASGVLFEKHFDTEEKLVSFTQHLYAYLEANRE